MKRIATTFYETKVRYEKQMENGMTKTVRETFAVDANSFTEAESMTMKEMEPYIHDEFTIVEEKIAPYKEVFLSKDSADDKFYKVKVDMVVLDGFRGTEKRTSVYFLVQAASVDGARNVVTEANRECLADNEVVSVAKTKVLDVFLHESHAAN